MEVIIIINLSNKGLIVLRSVYMPVYSSLFYSPPLFVSHLSPLPPPPIPATLLSSFSIFPLSVHVYIVPQPLCPLLFLSLACVFIIRYTCVSACFVTCVRACTRVFKCLLRVYKME